MADNADTTGSHDVDADDERAGRLQGVQRWFVYACGLAVACFVVLQVMSSIQAKGPEAKLKRLMPQIGADLVDAPLTAAQATLPMERDPQLGGSMRLNEFPSDTLIFVNFWATWCKPCRDELPSMFRLRRELNGRRFIMVAISYDDSWDTIRDFFVRWAGGMPASRDMLLLRDPVTDGEGTLREAFGTSKLPDSYVLYNGKVVARFVNARDWANPSIVEYFKRLTEPG